MDTSGGSERLYIVEEIIKKRTVGGKIQYYIKWQDYPHYQNTWEPATNLPPEMIDEFNEKLRTLGRVEALKSLSTEQPSSTTDFIPKQELVDDENDEDNETDSSDYNIVSTFQEKTKVQANAGSYQVLNVISDEETDMELGSDASMSEYEENGFERGFSPEKVLGVNRDSDNELQVIIKWKNKKKRPEAIPSRIAKTRCPQLMIDYYERHVKFDPDKHEGSDGSITSSSEEDSGASNDESSTAEDSDTEESNGMEEEEETEEIKSQ